jgi:hypothetical protein
MKNSFAIDTGDERHVVGHFVSGAVAGAIAGGTLNYNKYKNDELTKDQLFNTTAKTTVQAGIGTAAAISTANNMGKGNWLGVFASIGIGVIGVYGTQKFYDKLDSSYSKNEAIEQKVEEEK